MIEIPPITDEEFNFLTTFLRKECGLHFEKNKKKFLSKIFWDNLEKLGLKSYLEYFNYLKFNPNSQNEIKNLIDLLTVGETYFFRNKPQFDALMEYVIPDIIKEKENTLNHTIRVWSAGCSNGAEPYSIAIALFEVLPLSQDWTISILATDIDRNALDIAKNGAFHEKDIRYLTHEYVNKYFIKKDDCYFIKENVKKLVCFKNHNLVNYVDYLVEMQNLDIIFCRNVTIYFDLETTKKVMENLYHCLRNNGFLFLGHAETLWQIFNKFTVIEFPRTFIYKKSPHVDLKQETKPFIEIPEIINHQKEPLFNVKLQTKKVIADVSKDYIKALFEKAISDAKEAKYPEALGALDKIVEYDNLYGDAYYLSGVLSYKIGDLNKAKNQFKKVVYIDPEYALAYFNLGNIYLYENDLSSAAQEFKNAIKVLQSKPKDELVGFSKDYSVEILLLACGNNLKKITEDTST